MSIRAKFCDVAVNQYFCVDKIKLDLYSYKEIYMAQEKKQDKGDVICWPGGHDHVLMVIWGKINFLI